MKKYVCIKSFTFEKVKFVKGTTYCLNGRFITDEDFTFGVMFNDKFKVYFKEI